jgi:hypothetical protein
MTFLYFPITEESPMEHVPSDLERMTYFEHGYLA